MFPVLVEVVHLLTQAPTVFARSVHFRIDDNSGHFLSHALAHDSDFIVVQPQSGLSEFLSADLNQPGDFPVVRIAGKSEVIRISCKFEIVVQRIELEGEIKIMQQESGDVRTGHRTLRKMPVQRAEFRKHDRAFSVSVYLRKRARTRLYFRDGKKSLTSSAMTTGRPQWFSALSFMEVPGSNAVAADIKLVISFLVTSASGS